MALDEKSIIATEQAREVAAKVNAANDELQRAATMATMVARVATALAQCKPVSDIADDVIDLTVEALDAGACALFLANPHGGELRLVAHRHLTPDVAELYSTLSFAAPGAASRAARTREMQVIDDVRQPTDEPPLVQQFLKGVRARRLVGVPLIAREELMGVIVYMLSEPHAFATDYLAFEAVASMVAIGLCNAMALDHLAHERARLETIFEHAPHAIVYLNVAEGRTTRNPAAQRILGLKVTGGSREPLVRAFYPDGRLVADEDGPLARALRGETVSRVELVVEAADGVKRPVLASGTPIIGPSGTVEGVVTAFEDISVLKELDRLREEFAAIVAHDLRNPISTILMTAEMMLGASPRDDQVLVKTASVERIRNSAARLGEMVKDLLEASRIEIGRVALDVKSVDPVEAMNALITRVQPTLGEHPVELDAGGTRSCIAVDPLRFDQIFTNLLENAAKYSPDGARILVRIREREQGIAVAVVDQGIGISPDEIPLLFDRFFQAKRARQMRKGLGLGLYITKGFVDAHGGRITVDSTPGKGSTFEIWLPNTQPKPPHAAESAENK
jgi:PAS domain S-box-containing protein